MENILLTAGLIFVIIIGFWAVHMLDKTLAGLGKTTRRTKTNKTLKVSWNTGKNAALKTLLNFFIK